MKNLNLDALHKVPELIAKYGTFPRRIGKTTYAIYSVIGALQCFEDETICVLVKNDEELDLFLQRFYLACVENDLDPMWVAPFKRVWFNNNSNHVKFITLETIQIAHPTTFAKEKSFNNFIVTDLNNMPPEFFQEEITIVNSEILNKYSRYLK